MSNDDEERSSRTLYSSDNLCPCSKSQNYIVYFYFQSSKKTYTLGANVTLSDMIELFTKEGNKAGASGGYNELKNYLYRVASCPIRNVSMSTNL